MKSIGNNFNVTVLEGVAGSGKTLVYFERIKDFINKGFQALILLPEIALTNQFSRRFKEFFGAEPAILHSSTTNYYISIIWSYDKITTAFSNVSMLLIKIIFLFPIVSSLCQYDNI